MTDQDELDALQTQIDAFLSKASEAPNGVAIAREVLSIGIMLFEKNKAYGSSLYDPLQIFSDSKPYAQILARIDDKLNRILHAESIRDMEDDVRDLIGYLVHLCVQWEEES